MRALVLTALRAIGLAALLLLIPACSGDENPDDDVVLDEDDPARRAPTQQPRRYRAEWIIEPTSAGREGGLYVYAEVIDDRNGLYSAQSGTHRAVQTRESVAICADILRPPEDVKCASIERADAVPDVASYAITRLREWSARGIFELAGEPSMAAAAAANPAVWRTTDENHRGVPVTCWEVTGETTAAPRGFKTCFTFDPNGLIASLDLTGDAILEVDLQNYAFDVDERDFELPYDVIEDPIVYDQLLFIFPELPVGSDDDTLAEPGASTGQG